jgi:hypothetical protein
MRTSSSRPVSPKPVRGGGAQARDNLDWRGAGTRRADHGKLAKGQGRGLAGPSQHPKGPKGIAGRIWSCPDSSPAPTCQLQSCPCSEVSRPPLHLAPQGLSPQPGPPLRGAVDGVRLCPVSSGGGTKRGT